LEAIGVKGDHKPTATLLPKCTREPLSCKDKVIFTHASDLASMVQWFSNLPAVTVILTAVVLESAHGFACSLVVFRLLIFLASSKQETGEFVREKRERIIVEQS
jgi:hypothetical protein